MFLKVVHVEEMEICFGKKTISKIPFKTKCWSENLIRLKEVKIFDENKTKKSGCPEAELHRPTDWSVNRFITIDINDNCSIWSFPVKGLKN